MFDTCCHRLGKTVCRCYLCHVERYPRESDHAHPRSAPQLILCYIPGPQVHLARHGRAISRGLDLAEFILRSINGSHRSRHLPALSPAAWRCWRRSAKPCHASSVASPRDAPAHPRNMPLSSNSPTASTVTASFTAIRTRGLIDVGERPAGASRTMKLAAFSSTAVQGGGNRRGVTAGTDALRSWVALW
jgi:hypothetical protein